MVIAAFPAAKLGALLISLVSRPIANKLKIRAKNHFFFRTYFCIPPAQFYNWCEIQIKMWMLNLGRPVNIPVLNEAMAIELGSNLLGEAIVFFILSAVAINEYNRSSRKEAAKEAVKQKELQTLMQTIQELRVLAVEQEKEIGSLMETLSDLAFKLFGLLLKLISKPAANALKRRAKESMIMRTYFCIPPARFYNWCETKVKMWMLKSGKSVNITVINEAMAIELGISLLGEAFVFFVAAAIVINEYNRQSRKDAAKEEAKRQTLHELQMTLQDLHFLKQKQTAQIRELTRAVSYLDSQ